MAYRYQEEEEQTQGATIAYDERDAKVSRSPRVLEELELLAKASAELREKVSQLDERLSCIMRPTPEVNPIPRDTDVPVPDERNCSVVHQIRDSRRVVDETRKRLRSILSLLEV